MAINVMSFNIRYGTAGDEENSWDNRRDLVMKIIHVERPDLLGTQETLDFQADFLLDELPGYGFHGVGRDDGERAGEMCAVYYNENLFERLDGGHIWLSETPGVPGSRSWGSACTRMVSWLKLRDKRFEDKELFFFNTHFDHHSQEARRESAKLLKKKISEIAGYEPVIITGDFNSPALPEEDDGVYYTLARNISDWFPPEIQLDHVGGLFIDGLALKNYSLHRSLSADPPVPAKTLASLLKDLRAATYHGFKGEKSSGRIDWILTSTLFGISRAEIVRTSSNGRFPSDHYPVISRLTWALKRDKR